MGLASKDKQYALSAFARMHVVQKEEKETRIREFIERDLALKAQEGARAEPAVYRLIALSPESPAAVALGQFAGRAAELGIEVQGRVPEATGRRQGW